jgi:uncharacterized protein (DUF362 family)
MSHVHRDGVSRRTALHTFAAASAVPIVGASGLLDGIARAAGHPDLAVITSADRRASVRAAVAALGGIERFVSRADVVFVKANIGWARAPMQAANTDPEVVAAVVELCVQAGARAVKVADRTLDMADRCYTRSGIRAAAERAGAQVFFADDTRFRTVRVGGAVMREWDVYIDALEADKRIDVPVAKQHSLCRMTGAMKNWFGVLGGDRGRLHRDIHQAVADMAQFFEPQLTVLDATRVLLRNGPQGGSLADVKALDTVVAGADQVAIDAFAATLLGIVPDQVGYIAEGHARHLGEMRLDRLRVLRRAV